MPSLRELIIEEVQKLPNIQQTISEQQFDQLALFADNLLKYGSLRGLTALKEANDIVRELIVDALGGATIIRSGSRIADLGSGGGVPGLPLAIVKADCQFVLVESQNRKVAWINEQIEALGLSDRVTAEAERIEDVCRNSHYRAKFDYVTAKALAALPVLIELSVPLLKVDGCLLAYKGIKAAEEMTQSETALKALGSQLEDTYEYSLDERRRYICLVKKIRPTTKQYPRRVGVPQHNPL